MQVVVEFLSAFMVWLAAAVLSHFGVDVDMDHRPPASVERVIDARARDAADPVSQACPEARARASKGKLAAI